MQRQADSWGDTRPDLVVIGGGVVGLCCALAARRAGAAVRVLNHSGPRPSASWGNAGHIATEQVEPLASPKALASAPRRLFAFGGALDLRGADLAAWADFAARYVTASGQERFEAGRAALGRLMSLALPAWRRLAQSLGDAALVCESGHLVVWESAATAAAGQAAWASADTGQARFTPLKPAALAALAPRIKTPLAAGLRFQGTAQVRDPLLVLQSLRASLLAEGGALSEAKVTRLSHESSGLVLILDNGERIQPGRVLIAGGIGSGPLMRQTGHVAPLAAERGYHIEGPAGAWGELPPVVFEDRSMIVTRFGDRLRAASFVEFAASASPPDPRKWARLQRHARAVGLPLGEDVQTWMGARPTLPDYLPAIGVSRRIPGLFYAFGHQHLGLTLAAATGEILADLLTGQAPPVDLAPFDIERFSGRGRALNPSPMEAQA